MLRLPRAVSFGRTALLLAGLLLAVAILVGHPNRVSAAVYTVDSTGDSGDFNTADGVCDTNDSVGNGPCTLRAAIEQANAGSGTDTIAFSIAGGGPHTISPGSALPTISFPVIIDGYTQAGASANTNPIASGSNAVLKIVLVGTGAGGA